MNILIVGLGNFGEKYIEILNNLYEKANIYVLRHSKKKYNNALNLKIKDFFYDIKDTNSIIINAVIICNPCPYHVETANYFIKKNIHCLIEKPLSHNYSEGLKLLNNLNCNIQIGYLLLYSDLFNYLKNYKKYIGKLLLLKINVGQYLPSWRKKDYRNCVSSKKINGGGVLLELSHDINNIFAFLNIKLYKIKSISKKISELEIDVEDFCYIILEATLNNGDLVNINISLDMLDFIHTRTYRLIGNMGSMNIDYINNKIEIINNKNQTIQLDKNKNLLKTQIIDFFKNINNSTFSNKTIDTALSTLKLIDNIKNDNNIKFYK